jgi:hypothetical protein
VDPSRAVAAIEQGIATSAFPGAVLLVGRGDEIVFHDGFVYGLDDVLLECVELQTGKVEWKARRRPAFGHGQIILIGDVLVVVSESGELALVGASPKGYHEFGHIQALDSDEPTWSNPAFSSPYLLRKC